MNCLANLARWLALLASVISVAAEASAGQRVKEPSLASTTQYVLFNRAPGRGMNQFFSHESWPEAVRGNPGAIPQPAHFADSNRHQLRLLLFPYAPRDDRGGAARLS
jgi:hypothetical protein